MAPTEVKAPAKVWTATATKLSKERLLQQITSLSTDDDERTTISKKLSWILRHGAKKLRLATTDDGWIKVSELLSVELLDDVTEDKLMKVIAESNAQKPRYELREGDDGQFIKAIRRDKEKNCPGLVPGPRKDSKAGEDEGKETVEMRKDAPVFIPAQLGSYGYPPMMPSPMASPFAYSAHAGMGYPWPLAHYGYPSPMASAAASQTARWPGAMNPALYGATPAAPDASLPAGRYRGWIKTFNAEKKFGFIESRDAAAKFGRDVFLHQSNIGDFTIGSEITFTVGTNRQGMPQARDLAAIDSSSPDKSGKGKAGKGKACKGKGEKGEKGEKSDKGKGKSGKGKDKDESFSKNEDEAASKDEEEGAGKGEKESATEDRDEDVGAKENASAKEMHEEGASEDKIDDASKEADKASSKDKDGDASKETNESASTKEATEAAVCADTVVAAAEQPAAPPS
eukprot:TRINITY_DN75899_c0_g1_i1.p1 TRINITY_DN75899_c0_g1~~TRINITY_DN75899_c0_g1_i1.p1  ORF type:complete len:478 (-),score=108.86 TRINITY_DN75899_c0_g1_i1:135-1502(-)